jgi:hypothetical protein
LRAVAAGFVGSIALCLHNPVPHMLFAVPWLIWVATRPRGIRLLALLCVGYLPLCLLLGVGWFEFSNHLRDSGLDSGAAADTDRLRAITSVFAPPTATVLLARFIGVAKIWIWAVPGLLILAVYGAVRCRRNALCMLFAASAAITLIGYLFVPADQGHGWGYRYFHSAWMALPLLATAAMFRPVGISNTRQHADTTAADIFADPDTKAFVTACVLLTLVFGVGFRAWEMQDFIAWDLNQLPHYTGTERRVVILDPTLGFYGGDLVQNDPWLRSNEIRMYTHGPTDDQQLMAEYYPTLKRVFADRHGSVWSAKPTANPGISTDDAVHQH